MNSPPSKESTLDRILVPVQFTITTTDGVDDPQLTTDSTAAIDQALRLAEAAGGSVTFAHVFNVREEPGPPSDSGTLPAIRRELQDLTDQATIRHVPADHALLFGQPDDEICSLARAEDFQLIVMGTRQGAGAGHALIGSNAARVISGAPVPTWVARPRPIVRGAVIAATKLTPECDHVLQQAISISRALKSDLHIIHACPAIENQGNTTDQARLRLARAHVEAQMAKAVGSRIVPRFHSHVEIGTPEDVLWRAARTLEALVIIVGVADHTAVERLLRADTAEALLSELPCSLMSIRTDR